MVRLHHTSTDELSAVDSSLRHAGSVRSSLPSLSPYAPLPIRFAGQLRRAASLATAVLCLSACDNVEVERIEPECANSSGAEAAVTVEKGSAVGQWFVRTPQEAGTTEWEVLRNQSVLRLVRASLMATATTAEPGPCGFVRAEEIEILGRGNTEYAVAVRNPADDTVPVEFVSGVHNFETVTTESVELDGVSIRDVPVGTILSGSSLRIVSTTSLDFPTPEEPGEPFAALTYEMTFSSLGYELVMSRDLLRDAFLGNEFVGMLIGPTTATDPLAASTIRCTTLDGGAVSADVGLQAGRVNLPLCSRYALVGQSYAAEANLSLLAVRHASEGGEPGSRMFLVDRPDTRAKLYYKSESNEQGPNAPGVLYKAGASDSWQLSYSILDPTSVPGPDRSIGGR